ncbi:hypothetical protein BKA58DRAFT_325530 [Alternaria rosae]|uniref:uncharacterized protein n=1 Tax=Alternaria rosae TaxID=1187941 RepID=UPI001E8E4984|nr:uncharacterized protein BKA58DRAFT_325530 [Alternaria rosae]KAH6857286.1 hypothetical protein BKA58DRAFT_325530 [Alternaria rosae]
MANPKPRFPHFVESPGKLSYKPARYIRNPGWRGWYQDDRKLHDVKASKAFIWPKDGRNGSRWGRMKDVFNNEGPDMYVAFGARKSECVSNRPRKSQWAGHYHLNGPHQPFSFNSSKYSPWTRDDMLGGRDKGKSYDFRTREYTDPSLDMWTNAVWQPEPYGNREWNCYPKAMRDYFGEWHHDCQYLPLGFNGLIDNEFGRGWRFR